MHNHTTRDTKIGNRVFLYKVCFKFCIDLAVVHGNPLHKPCYPIRSAVSYVTAPADRVSEF